MLRAGVRDVAGGRMMARRCMQCRARTRRWPPDPATGRRRPPAPAAAASTSKPSRSSNASARSARRRLAKQPPASATSAGPPLARARWHAARMIWAMVSWKRAAITGTGRPARRSAASAATVPRRSTTKGAAPAGLRADGRREREGKAAVQAGRGARLQLAGRLPVVADLAAPGRTGPRRRRTSGPPRWRAGRGAAVPQQPFQLRPGAGTRHRAPADRGARPRRATPPAARRQGSRMAASPPGRASGHRWPRRTKPSRSASRISPPQICWSGPRPVPSKATPSAGPGAAVLGQAGGDVGVVVLHGQQRQPASLGRGAQRVDR